MDINGTEMFNLGFTDIMSTTMIPDTMMTGSSTDGGLTELVGLLSTTMMPEASTAAPWDFRTWIGDMIMQRTTSTTQSSFLQGFIASLSFIIVSELGDKTFFIAAIMAMKHPRLVVFGGAISALVFMTILSAAFGSIATFIPRVYTYYASAVLFAIFGLKMLRDGWKMDPNEGQEELEEVQMELKRREDQEAARERARSPESVVTTSICTESGPSQAPIATPETSRTPEESQPGPSKLSDTLREEKEETLDMIEQGQAENRRRRRKAVVKIFLQAASLTFLAEWGDRSQLATVVLATRENVYGVVVGGALGHALCTGLAVIGGRMIAQKISVRTVTIIGGLVFLFFAISALFIDPGE